MTKAFFVTGTDTEVGKTFVSCALLESFAKQGLSTLALKPVAAGTVEQDGQWVNEDVVHLKRHMSVSLPYEQINPVLLHAAASPHIAAHLEQRNVSVSRLVGVCRGALMSRPDIALIEGAGGWRVPISKRETMADLAVQLGYPVIIVVALRLGCLNHAMLTAEAVRRDGLKVAGWVANCVSPEPMAYEAENLATLMSTIDAPLLGRLDYSEAHDPKLVCNSLNTECLYL